MNKMMSQNQDKQDEIYLKNVYKSYLNGYCDYHNINGKDDINRAADQGKPFVFKYRKRRTGGKISSFFVLFPIILIVISISMFSFIFLLISRSTSGSIPILLIFIMILFIVIPLIMLFANIKQNISFRYEKQMLKEGFIIIGPQGILYHSTKNVTKYFQWNQIVSVEKGWHYYSDDMGKLYKKFDNLVWCKFTFLDLI